MCPFSPYCPVFSDFDGRPLSLFPVVCTSVTWAHFRSMIGSPTADHQVPWKGPLGNKSLTPEQSESLIGILLKAQVPYKPYVDRYSLSEADSLLGEENLIQTETHSLRFYPELVIFLTFENVFILLRFPPAFLNVRCSCDLKKYFFFFFKGV